MNETKDNDTNIISLCKIKKISKEEMNKEIEDIQESIQSHRDELAKIQNFDLEALKKRNFITTKGALNRLNEIYNYIKLGIHLIIEGPTGTSKTFSVETICNQLIEDQKKDSSKISRKIKGLKKFSLCQDTKPSDLMGTFVGDSNSLSGLKFQRGLFIEAFEEGYCLLLDEINLASKEVLQCIEDAIDSKVLSFQNNGEVIPIKMHPNFCLIATQNPNKGKFAGKRQELGLKFLSKFTIIEFPGFTEEELLEIANGLAEGFGYYNEKKDIDKRKKIIEDLVSFHVEWSKNKLIEDDIQCFTIREISASVKAISKGEDPFKVITIIYGARYLSKIKKELIATLKKRDSFKNGNIDLNYKIPLDFHNCFPTKSLSQAIESILFSFKNERNVIISGKQGTGKTSLALWIGEYFEKINKHYNISESSLFICTEENKPSDLIGKQKPLDKKSLEKGGQVITFEPGILIKAIQNGKVCILDNIEQLQPTVTERLNASLDKKYNDEQPKIEVPENPEWKDGIDINKDYRLLCTANIDKLNKLSPAFINRFDVIVLEDQLEEIRNNNNQNLKDLLKKLFENSVSIIRESDIVEAKKVDDEGDEDFNADGINFDEEEENEDGNENGNENENRENENKENENKEIENNKNGKNNAEQNIEIKYNVDNELIDLIYNNYIEIQKESKTLTIYNLSILCRAIRIFDEKFKEMNIKKLKITKQDLINFTFSLCLNYEIEGTNLEIPSKIQELILDYLPEEPNSDDSKFFYKNSEKLKKFMTIVHASSMINLPLIIYGSPGVGKTAMIRSYGRIRQYKMGKYDKDKSSFQIHTFHSGTKPSDFFGTNILKEGGQIGYVNGTLITAIKEGLIFIADEMNVSSPTTMKSLAIALETNINQGIYFPSVEEIIFPSENFHFIVCQNFVGTIGRNLVPDSIISRFRVLNYPEQSEEDIQKICIDIKNSLYGEKEKQKFIDDAKKVGSFMYFLNKSDIRCVQKWSFRDIKKLFKRIYYQEKHPKDFKEIKVPLNLLFYITSPLNKEEINKYIDEILLYIKRSDVFDIDEDTVEEYKKCILDPPNISIETDINGNQKHYLMKNRCGLSLKIFNELFEKNKTNSSISDIDFEFLPSFINDLFKVSLADSEEPILLTGPTGYKTFLAQQFISGIEPINLNQETTIEQLLGSPIFLYKSQAKYFYLYNLCLINGDNRYEELKLKLDQGKLNSNDIILKDSISFKYALKHLKEKLFDKSNTKSTNSSGFSASDIVIEFNLGLIMKAIFGDKSLLLKNLSEIPTSELERFNELFSGFTVTLHEDIYNTFSNPLDKEIRNFSKRIRFFATCSQGSATKLSEAVLSRFTLICTETYEKKEQNYVLKNFNKVKELNFSDEEINKVIDFSDKIALKMKKSFSLTQMINALYIAYNMNKNKPNQRSFNLSFSLYYLSYGLLERRKFNNYDFEENLLVISGLKEESIKYNIPLAKNLINETPLEFYQNEKGYKMVKSKLTNLEIMTRQDSLSNMNIYFSQNLIEMVNLVHLSLITHIPIIFDAELTQGKKTAIKYVVESLGSTPVFINLIPNINSSDLLGKTSITKVNNNLKIEFIKTKLTKALEDTSNAANTLLIFENINNASSAVLQLLTNIFDYKQTQIPLPNNTLLQKGTINAIGLWNPQNGYSTKDKLPSNLINSCIYFTFKYQEENELKDILMKIINQKFKNTSFSNDVVNFYKKYMTTLSFLNQENENTLNLNDVDKYITLREASEDLLDENTISKIIFAYCVSDQEKIDKIINLLGLDQLKFNPTFTHNFENQQIYFQINKDSEKRLVLNTYKSNFTNDEIEEINIQKSSLTSPQKQCLLCLALCHKAEQTCLVGGGVACGKTSIIRYFAKIMGKKITTYEMDADTDSSFISGQPKILDKLEKDEIIKISVLFSQINEFGFKEKIIENEEFQNIDNFGKKDFDNIITRIKEKSKETDKYNDEIVFNDELNDNKERKVQRKELIEDNLRIIQNIILPANRFKSVTSTMINSMKNGDWVLIDNIQLASPQIIELISSLCGKYPFVDLIEKGDDFYFSREKNAKNKIHKDFRLFITIDPSYTLNTNIIDQSLRPKCISFNLPPLDSKPEYSAQIFHSSLKNSLKNNINNDIIIDKSKIYLALAPKLANVHAYVLEKSKLNVDDFSGGCQMTSRKINNFCKEFCDNSTLLKDQIIDGLRAIYYNTYINHEINQNGKEEKYINFKNDIIKEFKKDSKYFFDDINIEDQYEDLLNILRDIQLICEGKKNQIRFDFGKFLNYCLEIKICDLNYILSHIIDTFEKFINKSTNINDEKKLEYGQINLIKSIFEEIKLNKSYLLGHELELLLNDKLLLKNENMIQSIFKLNLLSNILTKDELYYYQKYNYQKDYLSLFNNININIQKLKKEQNIKVFAEFLLELKKNPDIYENIFPNAIFKGTNIEFINHIIPLVIKIIKDKSFILFKFPNNNDIKEVSFGKKTKSGLYTEVILESDDLLFSIGSKILCFSKKMQEELKSNKREEVFYFLRLIEKFYNTKDITKSMKDQYKKELSISSNIIQLKEDYFNLKYFFRNDNESTLIGMATSLCLNTKKEFIDIIEPYLLICERDIIRFIKILIFSLIPNITYENYFEVLDKVNRYIKSFSSFCPNHSYLWKSINGKLEIDTDSLSRIKKEIQIEKNDLKRIITVEKEYFNMEVYEEILNKEEDNIAILESKEESNLEQKELKIKFDKLISILRNHIFKDKNLDLFSQGLISEIQNIIKRKMSSEIYENKNKEVENLIAEDSKSDKTKSNEGETFISWPEYTSNISSDVKSDDIKLIEHLIWYSYYYSIFLSIKEEKLDDPTKQREKIKKIMERNDQTMKNLSKYLISVISNGDKIKDEIEVMFSTLNSEFIRKIEKDNLLSQIFNLPTIINEYKNRNKKKEYFYNWLNSILSKYNSTFKLYLPKFTKSDIFYLYLQCDKCIKETDDFSSISKIIYKPGISLSDLSIRRDFFGYLREEINLKNIQNNTDCIDNIAKIIYNKLFDKRNSPYLNGHENLVNKFNEKLNEIENIIEELNKTNNKNLTKGELISIEKQKRETLEKKSLIIRILNSLDLAPKLDNSMISNLKLTYDDDKIVDFKTWDKDKELLLCKNPSILFWLSKYNNYAEKFPSFKSDEYSIDFWFFCFRILSSYNCIKCDIPVQKYCDYINQLVIKHFESNSGNDYNFGKDWVSLMIKNPSKIKNKEISNIYNFLYILLSDKKEFKKNIENEREECLKAIIKALYKKLFDNKLFDFINGNNADDIDNKNLINFFMNPSHFIYQNIEHKFKNILDKINNTSESLIQVFENFKSVIPEKIEVIRQKSENEIKLLKEIYIKEQKIINEIQLKDNINNANKCKENYIDSLQKFIDSENKVLYKYEPNEIKSIIDEICSLNKKINKLQNEKKSENKNNKTLINILSKIKEQKVLLKKKSDNSVSDFSKEALIKLLKNKENIMEELLDKNKKSIEFKKIILNDFLKDKYYLVKTLNNKCSISIISKETEFYLDKNATFKLYNKKTLEEDNNAFKNCSIEHFNSLNESFDITSFYQNESNKPIDDTKSKTLIFGEKCIQINDFIKKMNQYSSNIGNLKNIIELLKDLSINYNLKNSKEYNRKIIAGLKNIELQNNDIIKSLSCKYSGNGGECKNIQGLLDDFKKPLEQFIDQVNNFNEEIQNISDFWSNFNELNSEKDLFSNDYSFPKIIDLTNKNFSFAGLNPDCENLSLPLVSLEQNVITFNPEKIIYHFGNICPYLYKDKIGFNILCFIDPSEKIIIESNNKEEVTCISNFNNSLLKLYITIPDLEKEETQENKTICGSLIFKSENGNIERKELPFEFSFNLIPLILYFSNTKYKLLKNINDNREFKLKVDKVFSGEEIRFDIKYYHLLQLPTFDVTLHNNIDNEADKPYLRKNLDDGYFTITIPEEKKLKFKKLSCHLYVYFKGTFKIKIIINAIIIPLDFSFYIYDFFDKTFRNDSTIFLNDKNLPLEIPLIFRIEKPYQEKVKGTLTFESDSRKGFVYKINSNINNIDIEEYLIINITIQNFSITNKSELIRVYLNINNYRKPINIKFEFKTDCQSIDELKKFKTFQNSLGNWENLKYDDLKPIKCTYTMLGLSNFYSSENLPHFTFLYEKRKKFVVTFIDYEIIKNSKNSIKEKIFESKEKKEDGYMYRAIFAIYKNNEKDKEYLLFYPYDYSYDKNKIKLSDIQNLEKNLNLMEKNYISNNQVLKDNHQLFNIFENYEKFVKYLLDNFYNCKIIKEKLFNGINQDNYNLKENKYKFILNYFDLCQNYKDYDQISIFSFHKIDDNILKQFQKETYCLKDYDKIKFDKSEEEIIKLRTEFENSIIINKNKNEEILNNIEESDAFKISQISSEKEDKNADLKILNNNNDSINVSSSKKFEIKLPDIDINNIVTINDAVHLLSSSFPVIRILPIFLRNSFKFEEKDNENIAKKIFLKLYSIYMSVNKCQNCFISNQIKDFIQSFNLLICKLKKARVNFSSILPDFEFNINSNNQSFIDFPDIQIGFDLEKLEKWEKKEIDENTEESLSDNILSLKNGLLLGQEDQLQKAKYRRVNTMTNISNQDEISEVENMGDEKENELNEQEKELKRKKEDMRKKEEEKENERLMNEFNKYACLNIQNDDNDAQFNNNSDENTEETRKKSDNETTGSNEEYFNNKFIPPSQSQMKELVENFKEEDAFKIIIEKLLSFKAPYPSLDIGENFKSYNIIHIDDKANTKDFPVKDLIKLSYDISAYLISVSTLDTVPYNQLCVNILFDVSFFISDENKLFNMFLLCCVITALSNMEIPYSVTLISDENFKCTIKRFSDEHSLENIQKIFDCIFVRRFYTNLANNTKFAINNLYYKPKEERPYRAFITFSNGLDERLFMADNWESKVFKSCSEPQKNKFGYVFLRGELLKDENLSRMETVWDNFEKENNKRLKLTIINYPDKYEQLNLNKLDDPNNLIVKLGEMFSFILQFKYDIQEQKIEKTNLPQFKLDKLDNLENIYLLKQRDFSNSHGIYTNKTDILMKTKNLSLTLDNKHYKNYFGKITKTDLDDPDKNLGQSLKELIAYMKENKQKLGPTAIETVFKYNYATQKVLSTQGSEFDITALIFHLINPSPNPRIYLQKKINDKRKYSIYIVVDSSYSCYNDLSGSHAFQTLRALLSAVNIYELPSLNLIVSGEKEPYVLCSNIPTVRALKNNSSFWESFFKIIQKRNIKTDLFSAISAAYDLKRLHPEDYPSYLFVLTDGLYDKTEQQNIINIIGACSNSGMNIFGIGVGIYPKLNDNLFPQVVYCENPNDVMKGIASFMGENLSSRLDEINLMFSGENNLNKISDIFNSLKSNINSPIFNSLKEELENIDVGQEAMSFIINDNKNTKTNKQLLRKGVLKGQKILLVMLWDCSMSNSENYRVDPDYIVSPSPGNKFCLKDAASFYGVEIKIVQNYKDAINEITREEKGKCPYYSIWVICGPPYRILPNENDDPELIGQFNDLLLKFWENKGSLIFLAEGTPLCYQVNLFLENAEFPSYGKLNFRIGGEQKADKKLKPDDSGILEKNGTYNSKITLTAKNEKVKKSIVRTTIARGMGDMYEGDTISYACSSKNFDYLNKNLKPITNTSELKPFTSFIKNTDGGISCLLYSDDSNERGDIVIYCGFTICFTDMKSEDDSYKFFQNIIGYTARPEIHLILDKESPFEWRPKVVHKPNKPITSYKFSEIPKLVIERVKPSSSLINLFCFDNSGSISGISDIYFNTCNNIINDFYKNGDKFYLWSSSYYSKTYNEIISWINSKNASGGTNSELIAQIAKEIGNYSNIHLILVTDGEVSESNIKKSDDLMKQYGIKFGYFTGYIVGPNSNYSVLAPYARDSESQFISVRYNNNKKIETLVEKSVTKADINALKNLENIDDFDKFRENIGRISKAIIALMMGKKNDDELKNRIENMKNRIYNKLDAKSKAKFNTSYDKLIKMVTGGLKDAFSLDSISGFSFN